MYITCMYFETSCSLEWKMYYFCYYFFHRYTDSVLFSVTLYHFVMSGLIAACLSALLTELIALSKMAILLNNKLL